MRNTAFYDKPLIFTRATFQEKLGSHYLVSITDKSCLSSCRTAQVLSHYRPRCPTILITRNSQVARQAHLSRGLFPLYYDEPRENNWSDDVNARLLYAVKTGQNMGFIRPGSFIVFVVGWSPGSQTTNTMRILQVKADGEVIGRRNEAEIFFT